MSGRAQDFGWIKLRGVASAETKPNIRGSPLKGMVAAFVQPGGVWALARLE